MSQHAFGAAAFAVVPAVPAVGVEGDCCCQDDAIRLSAITSSFAVPASLLLFVAYVFPYFSLIIF